MRIIAIQEKTFPISRYADPGIAPGGLTTSAVAILTDIIRDGVPVVGFGFASFGRFGQGGLIRERFAPRLLAASDQALTAETGENLDPFRAWNVMMQEEKPGGHGERSVAVGTLDMALWDAAAKIAKKPLYRFLSEQLGEAPDSARVRVYAGGGYYFPERDLQRLADEVRYFLDQGQALRSKCSRSPTSTADKRTSTVGKPL